MILGGPLLSSAHSLTRPFFLQPRSPSRCQLATRGLGCDRKRINPSDPDPERLDDASREDIENGDECRCGTPTREQCRGTPRIVLP